MSIWSAILHLLLVLGAVLDLFSRFASRKLPPGPTPLPIIGNIHQLAGSNPLRVLEKLAKSYGSIMTLRLGQVTTIVISSSGIARKVLREQDNVFANRPIPNAFHAHDYYKYSVFWLPVGNRWRSIRKFFHSGLFSGNKLEMSRPLRHEKVAEFIDYAKICGENGKAIDVRRAGFVTSLNIMSNTLFSLNLAKYDEDDSTTRELKEFRENALQVAGSVNLVDFFPLLGYIDPQGIRRCMKFHIGKIQQFFYPLINQKLELNRSSETVTMTRNHDAMNILSKSSEDVMDKTQIEWICFDLFLAGTSGTSAALEWAMAELMRHPEVLKKAKAELELVVGKGNIVEESHIPDLPYLNAIVKETLRLHPTGPLVPRIADVDVEIDGYIIPKGTQVYINLLAIGREAATWPNPMSFIPERFVGSKIDLKGHDFELIPFGAGRRICPGMSFSLRTVPVMLGSLVNSFDWKLESGIGPEDVDMEEKFAVTFHKAHALRIIPIKRY